MVADASDRVGSQCIVVAIDAKRSLRRRKGGSVHHGGRKNVGPTPSGSAKVAESGCAGEILLTSMDRDGTKSGFTIWSLTRRRVRGS